MLNLWNTIKKFKSKSLFIKYFTHILILAFILNAFFAVFVYRTYIQNLSERNSAALSAFLDQTMEETDNSIKLLYDSILVVAKDPTIGNWVAVPSAATNTKNVAITRRLSNTANGLDYINALYLYERSNHMIITSDELILNKNEENYHKLVENCFYHESFYFANSNRERAKLCFIDNKLYMVVEFMPVQYQFLGVLVAEINTDKLFSGIHDTISPTDYSVSINIGEQNLFVSNDQENADIYSILSKKSDLTHWYYQLSSSHTDKYSFIEFIKSVLPAQILLFLLAAFISLLITVYIYTPIYHLLFKLEDEEEVNVSNAPNTPIDNELDKLESTYSRLANENKAAEMFISDVRPELEAKLILDLIHKNEKCTKDYIHSQIRILNSSLNNESKYQCFKIKLIMVENSDQFIYYMMYKQLQQNLHKCIDAALCRIYFLYFNDERFSFVVQYAAELTDKQILQIQNILVTELHKHLDEVSEYNIIASGKIYTGLEGIRTSYYEAKAESRKLIYYGNDDQMNSDEKSHKYDDKLQEIFQLTEYGKIDEMETTANDFVKTLCRDTDDVTTLHTVCSMLIDIILEKLYSSSSNIQENNISYADIYQNMEKLNDNEEIYLFMSKVLHNLSAELSKEFNHRQHRLIARAKDYIQSNYMDSNLSIHEIAEAIGITDTYLSTIFTEYTGENLITYLNNYRVEMAKELLLNTSIIIKDVGFKTGFYTIQNFNRVFKKFVGMTPGEFRKNEVNKE